MRKVIFNKKQLEEALGLDFSYLDGENDGYNEYNGQTEISTSGKLSSQEDGEPVTTDKIAKSIAPRTFYGFHGIRGNNGSRLVASYERSGISLNETNQDLAGKMFYIPTKIFEKLQNSLQKNQNNKSVDGYKRLKNLVNNRNINTKEMYNLKNFFENSGKTYEYEMLGGDAMATWVKDSLNMATSASYESKKLKKEMGQKNAFISQHKKDAKNGRGHQSSTAPLKPNFNYES